MQHVGAVAPGHTDHTNTKSNHVLQRAWRRRWNIFKHARSPIWYVRAHIGYAKWYELIQYVNVRREWRQEPSSWIDVDDQTLTAILDKLVGDYGS